MLLLVTDRRALAGSPWPSLPELARAAAAAGVDRFLVREKDLPARALGALVRDVLAAVRGSRLQVMVSARPDVATATGAAGVHLPEDGLPVADVRSAFPGLVVGASCHTVEGVRRAERAGAHYAVLGPVFATPGKEERVLGLEPLAEAAAAVAIPVIAIGGVEPGRAREVLGTGAAGMAAIRAFLHAPPAAVVAAFRSAEPPAWPA